MQVRCDEVGWEGRWKALGLPDEVFDWWEGVNGSLIVVGVDGRVWRVRESRGGVIRADELKGVKDGQGAVHAGATGSGKAAGKHES